MLSEEERMLDFYYIELVLRIVLLEMLQNIKFHLRLMLEFLFVSNYFERNRLTCLVVQTAQGLPERAFAQETLHLVAKADMVM